MDLNTVGIEALYAHQADILRSYQKDALNKENIAIELPTGSGKTLVGLLIAEFKRINWGERALYLCPTKQLVGQVIELAERYDIKTTPFIGTKSQYSVSSKSSYQNADSIAVTTYSSLFNTNPYFTESNLIIIDDAHAAENYIASNWSVNINRFKNEDIFNALVYFLKDKLEDHTSYKLLNDSYDPFYRGWVDKLPFKNFTSATIELRTLLDGLLNGTGNNLSYKWHNISDNLEACNLYFSWNEILIRPLIPPTLTNSAFANANQRIFMSATLGNGGDLERLTGISNFHKIPIPKGWDKEGLGRRFFVFPQQSLDESETLALLKNVFESTPRSLILTSSEEKVSELTSSISKISDVEIFTINDIELSKDTFINSRKGLLILANRFDGIDFPGEEARSLILFDIPYFANLQEKFLRARLDASIIYNDRNRTRLIQALGRCTRSPKDYSLVLIMGDGLTEWLTFKEKRSFFHPELQAEITFGINQSKKSTIKDLIDNIDIFFAQGDEWKEAEKQIIDYRNESNREPIPGEAELENVVSDEIRYLYALWNKDYVNALNYSQKVLEGLSGGHELKGYRGFWSYLSGAAAWLAGNDLDNNLYKTNSRKFLNKASVIAPSVTWLRKLADELPKAEVQFDEQLLLNIDTLLITLRAWNISRPSKFQLKLRELEEKLFRKEEFEAANEEIGKLLGFRTGNMSSTASPDPWWISSNNLVYVFEDKWYSTTDGYININDIRQANTHKDWILNNIKDLAKDVEIITIFLTNRAKIEAEHLFACSNLYYWSMNDFVNWSQKVINLFRTAGPSYTGDGDTNWKDYIINELTSNDFIPVSIKKKIVPLSTLVEKN
ncbi:DEAD/DEAH box helicase family protein [Larkinella bovis]|uniref:DEAD/DEAH box helicase family protein n=1 Tax=Larkinella bovis TaxID=683041 RepID=A0ABW0IAI2_9BACT